MKLLLDANLSPPIVEALCSAGYEAVHVVDLGHVTPRTRPDDGGADRAVLLESTRTPVIPGNVRQVTRSVRSG